MDSRRHITYALLMLLGIQTSPLCAWNPFSADDWNDLGGEIVKTASEVGQWLGDQATAVINELGNVVRWAGNQAREAYNQAKAATQTVYEEAVAPTGKFLEEATKKTITAVKDGTNIVVDRFKDTKVTRALDYYAQLGALTAAYEVARGVLQAAQTVAQGSIVASRASAQGVLDGAQGFLREVVRPSSNAILKGSAEAAKGVLEGAKQTGVGILEGGKWVVNTTLGQFDITVIHYDGNLRDFATGNLGNVTVEIVLVGKPVRFTVTLDLNNAAESLKPIIAKVADELKKTFVDPLAPQIRIVNTHKKEVDALVQKLAAQQPPKDALYTLEKISKAEKSWAVPGNLEQQLQEADRKAAQAPAVRITPQEFAQLGPQQKIARAGSLDPKIKAQMIATNVELLKKNKVCPGGYFENITLEGLDLSTAILQGAVMVGVTLRNVNFSSATMSGITIVSSKIDTCNFTKAKLDDSLLAALKPENQTVISNSNFFQANLSSAHVNAQFMTCNLDEINGVGLELKLSSLRAGTTLRKANLQWMEADMVVCDPRLQLSEADLRNAILVEVDLSQAILTQAHLERATLVFTRLSLAQADGVSLQGANFVYGVSLRGANLAKSVSSAETNWQGANLCGALMPDGTVNESDCKKTFIQHSWQVADSGVVNQNKSALMMHKKCSSCMLEGADLRGMNLAGFDLSNAWLVKADLRGANLRGANLRGARLQGAKVDAATAFDGAQFCRTLMANGSWNNQNCGTGMPVTTPVAQPLAEPTRAPAQTTTEQSGKNYVQANLEGASFTDALLTQANFSEATIKKADFKNAKMQGATMQRVKANGAKFFKANLDGADMRGGDFTNAIFNNATLTNVDVEGADFTGANLIGATWTPRGNSADKAIFCNTRMPNGVVNNRDCKK